MALSQRAAGVKWGWRSGLEEKVAASLSARYATFAYEAKTLEYTQPERPRKYTPDFRIATKSGKVLYVETKGRWLVADRQKLKLVVEQHPDIDLRLVFQNPNAKIAKGSKTTYAEWCEKHLGIPWAKGDVPDAWLLE